MPYQDYILLSLLWIGYCVVHSALISITVTDFLERALGDKYRFYRLFFNILSVGTLVPLLMYSNSARWKTELLFTWEGHLRIIQYCLIALAAILVLTGARHYSMLQFLGIRQILHARSGGAMTESGVFDSSGVLGVVRHPWYLAVFILLWAKDLNLTGITINLVLSAYLVIGTLLEERKLVFKCGEKYELYQGQVSMFIPLKWLRSTLHHSSRSQAVTSPVSTRGASGTPREPAPDSPGVFGRSPMVARIATLLVFGLAVSAGVRSVHVPPAVVPASAPPAAFSAERAMAHVRQIARAAHPTGSAEHRRVRAYLVAELRALGLEPRLQQTIGIASRFPVAGQVTNILARLPGTDTDGKAILMTAHYDSVAVGPGAADDAAGTAALLETLRALRAGSPLRNDLIIALLDGEEDGLLGAAAFVREHPWARDVGVALCLDAGGTGGRALLYETGERNESVVRAFGRTPNATGSSAMYSGYRRMPNDSDFSELRLAGITGLNIAISERGDRYHTPLDDPAHLDPRSLQHHGDAALGVAREFGMMALPPAAEEDVIFFNLACTRIRLLLAQMGSAARSLVCSGMARSPRRRLGAREAEVK